MDGFGVKSEIMFSYMAFLNHRATISSTIMIVRDYLDTSMAFNEEAQRIYSFLLKHGDCECSF